MNFKTLVLLKKMLNLKGGYGLEKSPGPAVHRRCLLSRGVRVCNMQSSIFHLSFSSQSLTAHQYTSSGLNYGAIRYILYSFGVSYSDFIVIVFGYECLLALFVYLH